MLVRAHFYAGAFHRAGTMQFVAGQRAIYGSEGLCVRHSDWRAARRVINILSAECIHRSPSAAFPLLLLPMSGGGTPPGVSRYLIESSDLHVDGRTVEG